ncbi:MAG: putative membrane protein YfcA [Flavobacteriales bacterium]|jgi:uncharacterized membrane protein YfcA
MDLNTLIILIAIGICAGILSGFVGVGGGMVIVPALIYFLGLTQFQAQGTSLALMIPPIGILAVMNYYKAGNVNLNYALIIAITFIVGGYIGSKLALRMSENKVKLIFGVLMLYASVRMIWKAWGNLANDV